MWRTNGSKVPGQGAVPEGRQPRAEFLYGYVNRVIPDAGIEDVTDAFARRIAATAG